TGSYLMLGDDADARLRVDLRLQDAAQGETVLSVTDGGTGRELIDLASRAGGRLRTRLGAPELSTDDAVAVRAMLPSDPDATRLYAEGLEHLRHHNYLVARDLLVKSVGTDPEHALAHIALAEAWRALGYTEKAREEARRAHVLSA